MRAGTVAPQAPTMQVTRLAVIGETMRSGAAAPQAPTMQVTRLAVIGETLRAGAAAPQEWGRGNVDGFGRTRRQAGGPAVRRPPALGSSLASSPSGRGALRNTARTRPRSPSLRSGGRVPERRAGLADSLRAGFWRGLWRSRHTLGRAGNGLAPGFLTVAGVRSGFRTRLAGVETVSAGFRAAWRLLRCCAQRSSQ
jgi:hypothetical protein